MRIMIWILLSSLALNYGIGLLQLFGVLPYPVFRRKSKTRVGDRDAET